MNEGRRSKGGLWDKFDHQRSGEDEEKLSQKSNDTARLSFSMNEEEVVENEPGSSASSPSRPNRAQMPVVNNIKTKPISSVFQENTQKLLKPKAHQRVISQQINSMYHSTPAVARIATASKPQQTTNQRQLTFSKGRDLSYGSNHKKSSVKSKMTSNQNSSLGIGIPLKKTKKLAPAQGLDGAKENGLKRVLNY